MSLHITISTDRVGGNKKHEDLLSSLSFQNTVRSQGQKPLFGRKSPASFHSEVSLAVFSSEVCMFLPLEIGHRDIFH